MRVIKKVLILILIISIFNFIPNRIPIVNASTIGNAMDGADRFLEQGNNSVENRQLLNQRGVYNVLNFLYGILLFAAIAFAVIKGILIGLKIVLGTIEERVDAKAMLVPYIWIVVGLACGDTVLRAILKLIMQ